MPIAAAGARERVLGFLRDERPPLVALEDPDGRGVRLLEPGSGKSLAVRWDDLDDAALQRTPLRPRPYLVLLFTDGRQVALADVGFAFAPSTRNTGPLAELPATFCFRDHATLLAGIANLILEEGREKEAARGILVAIALVDGARDLGFDVSHEERALEEQLGNLEARGTKL